MSYPYLFAALIPTALLTACVAYRAQPVDIEQLAEEVDTRSTGPLDYAAAVEHAQIHNPELKRLAAEARAVGLDIPTTNVRLLGNSLMEDTGFTLDPFALAKVYQRGAQADSAEARQAVALAALAEQQRRVAAQVAEAFLVERVLRDLESRIPEIGIDPLQFSRAGLASEADRQRAEFARKAERAERQTIESERRSNHARIRRLLALAPAAPVVLVLPEGAFPAFDSPTRERLLERPDLAIALARYYAADAEFREAVFAQYPTLRLGPVWNFGTNGVGGLVRIDLPVGGGDKARAASERREAARQGLESALLRAQDEAESSEADWIQTAARADAFAARAEAAVTGYDAALARLDVEPDAFGSAAMMASLATRTAMQARQTALVAARARVRRAEAYGWPRPEEMR